MQLRPLPPFGPAKPAQKASVKDVVLPTDRSADILTHDTVLNPVVHVEASPSVSPGIRDRVARLNANVSPIVHSSGIAKPFGWRAGDDASPEFTPPPVRESVSVEPPALTHKPVVPVVRPQAVPSVSTSVPTHSPMPMLPQKPQLGAEEAQAKAARRAAAAEKEKAFLAGLAAQREQAAQAIKREQAAQAAAATKIQAMVRGSQERFAQARKQVGAIEMQSLFRGYRARKQVREERVQRQQREAERVATKAAAASQHQQIASGKNPSLAERAKQVKLLTTLSAAAQEQFYAMNRAEQTRRAAAKALEQDKQEQLAPLEQERRAARDAEQAEALRRERERAKAQQVAAVEASAAKAARVKQRDEAAGLKHSARFKPEHAVRPGFNSSATRGLQPDEVGASVSPARRRR